MSTVISDDMIQNAARLLREGALVALPTETVYGLAADAANDRAVAGIFEVKGRPQFNPLIVHGADRESLEEIVEFNPLAMRLAKAFWPGPLTLVLPRLDGAALSHLVSAGLDSAAVRVPAHSAARSVISALGRPIAAPSANRSGAVSPTTAAHVRESLGDAIDHILDGGPCNVGVESTIVKIIEDQAVLLRPGGLPREEIENAMGAPLLSPASAAIEAPGMMKSHYAPSVTVRLNAEQSAPNEAYLGFGLVSPADFSNDMAAPFLNLSPSGDLREAAANLFSHLRRLDALCRAQGLSAIAVAPVPHHGLGEAINDRLARAASPKD